MNITQIEENIKHLTRDFHSNKVPKEQFIYDFLLAYGHRKSSVSRVKSGERNLSKVMGEVRWKRHVYFKHFEGDNLRLEAEKLKNDPAISRDRIRFVIVTDFYSFLAIDIKTGDSLDIKFDDIVKHFDFFLPWANMEKAVYQGENPADVKAAEKMAALFDIIKADNFNDTNKNDKEALHNLNVFLTRLLFCFFAEDTEIFSRNQFSHALESHTNADGSDVTEYLNRLFNVLNTSNANRRELPDYLDKFPFVNGGLFAKELPAPTFSTKSRKMLIECGKGLDWSDINPDIFGSMIQAVVHPDQRGGMGMHYTSVTNIMKVIEPLFLDELYKELENIQFNLDEKLKPSRLRKLKERLAKIKIFDPACGSGNFLIIAFKELRKLEMDVIKLLQEIEDQKHHNQDDLFTEAGLDSSFSEIKLSQFYGIELDDFAHEVAALSLWLIEHQMNLEFKTEFGYSPPSLPLAKGGYIVSGNALKLDWNTVCPNPLKNEVFIIGNPPYIGGKSQSKQQKSELSKVFTGVKNFKQLDYIAGWFYKAAHYINEKSSCAFVTTSSINQGAQVEQIWPLISALEVDIAFCYQPFKWNNNAKDNAGVSVSIIGLKQKNINTVKRIYSSLYSKVASNINGYLLDSSDIFLTKEACSISSLPAMITGNNPYDSGYLNFTEFEKVSFVEKHPESERFFRKAIGANELIKGIKRWCLWITNKNLADAIKVEGIKDRIEKVRLFRESGGDVARNIAYRPHQFRYTHSAVHNQIIIPLTSSESRDYMPIGYLNSDYIALSSVGAIYDAEPWVFGIVNSKMHHLWVKLTAGRLESRIRYLSALCYNTFPLRPLSNQDKERISLCAMEILAARELYPSSSLSNLYSKEKMPNDLRDAHKNLDDVVDNIYRDDKFKDDSERLSLLMKLYQEMTGGQNA
jgi:hypothetical protein